MGRVTLLCDKVTLLFAAMVMHLITTIPPTDRHKGGERTKRKEKDKDERKKEIINVRSMLTCFSLLLPQSGARGWANRWTSAYNMQYITMSFFFWLQPGENPILFAFILHSVQLFCSSSSFAILFARRFYAHFCARVALLYCVSYSPLRCILLTLDEIEYNFHI